MGFFDSIFGKKKQHSNCVEKITIPVIRKPSKKDFNNLIEDIILSFGKLYNRASETPVSFNANTVCDYPNGVYYGKTKYTEEVNRNGKKEVSFCLSDGSVFALLARNQWSAYEKNFETDDINWIGYYVDGTARIRVCTKFKEKYISDYLNDCSEKIAANELHNIIMNEVRKLNLSKGEFFNNKTKKESEYDNGQDSYDLSYNGKYMIAGCSIYVNAPFISVGYAENEPTNPFNPKAIAVYTSDGAKVGYVSEKDLKKYYNETGGKRTPLIIEAHYYNDKLYGWLYTYSDNAEEYVYMVSQYEYLLKNL